MCNIVLGPDKASWDEAVEAGALYDSMLVYQWTGLVTKIERHTLTQTFDSDRQKIPGGGGITVDSEIYRPVLVLDCEWEEKLRATRPECGLQCPREEL